MEYKNIKNIIVSNILFIFILREIIKAQTNMGGKVKEAARVENGERQKPKKMLSAHQLTVPPFFSLSRTEEPAKASTSARDRHALQHLALNAHIKHSDLT